MKVCVTGAPCGGSSTVTANVVRVVGGSQETHAFRELDAELLVRLGGAWDQPPVLDPGWERDATLDPLRDRAARLLEDVFASSASMSGVISWEDPQVALVLPFWRTVTSIDKTIVVVRDPAEVATSLQARYAIDAPQAALLWLRYLLSATANDPGHLLIRYDERAAESAAVLTAIADHIDLPAPGDVREALDPRSHPDRDPMTADDDNPLVALTRAVWNRGEVDIAAVTPICADAIRVGRLRSPVDGELLARARARVMKLRERVRRRHRHEAARECTTTNGGTRQ